MRAVCVPPRLAGLNTRNVGALTCLFTHGSPKVSQNRFSRRVIPADGAGEGVLRPPLLSSNQTCGFAAFRSRRINRQLGWCLLPQGAARVSQERAMGGERTNSRTDLCGGCRAGIPTATATPWLSHFPWNTRAVQSNALITALQPEATKLHRWPTRCTKCCGIPRRRQQWSQHAPHHSNCR